MITKSPNYLSPGFLALLLLLYASTAMAQKSEAWKLLSSKDVADRKAGLRQLRDGEDPKAEDHIRKALKDKDWEIIEVAAQALRVKGTAASLKALSQVAINGPIRRVRVAAAIAMGKIGKVEATKLLAKGGKGKNAAAVAEALGFIGGDEATTALEKLAKTSGGKIRNEIQRGLGRAGGKNYRTNFQKMLRASSLLTRLAGLEGMAGCGDQAALADLLAHLKNNPQRSQVEVRRCRFAIRRLLESIASDTERKPYVKAIAQAFRSSSNTIEGSRMARLVGELGRHKESVGDPSLWQNMLINVGLNFRAPQVLSAVLGAVRRSHAVDAYDKVAQLVENSEKDLLRFHGLRVCIALAEAKAESLAVKALETGKSNDLVEDAAALCGIHGYVKAGPALVKRLDASRWQTSCAAAISIGKIRYKKARNELEIMLRHKDWRRRGAAALALAWFRDNAATELLLGRLSDPDRYVRATIHRALEGITGRRGSDNKQKWVTWWRANRDGFKYVDVPMEKRKARDAGYDTGGYDLFKDVDVAVLDTEKGGDNIEDLLKRLHVSHRLTVAGHIEDAKLHPFALFIANCNGVIEGKDQERLEWFVRSGGYLFASCWALTETVNKTFPGIVEQHQTSTQVLDLVEAEALPRSKRFLRGVFRPGTRTQYVLEGSHLISVKDPERFEVLIDSPECASRWGEGNLAGWFTVGHGLVFDSANHFDLQGMKRNVPKTARGRRSMSMDRLGYSHAEARKLASKGVYKSAARCSKELEDLSMFRLITNFVRQKRFSEL